jgi:hypothetical protein
MVMNHPSTFYSEDKLEEVFESWNRINVDAGMIALPESKAHELGIPLGSPFYWDNSKHIYLLEGYHCLHCTVSFPPLVSGIT